MQSGVDGVNFQTNGAIVMPNRRYSSAYFRYFKARMLNFTRPAFWGTAIFLSITGLAIREFWINPDLLTRNRSRGRTENGNSRLSPEERAIAADIDNLPVLFFDFEQAVLPTLNAAKAQNNQRGQDTNRRVQESKNQETKTSSIPRDGGKVANLSVDNQFLKQAENLLKLESLQTGINRSSNNQFIGDRVTVNPLEAELNPSAYPQYSRLTGKATAPTYLEQALHQSSNPNWKTATGFTTAPANLTNNSTPSQVSNTNFNNTTDSSDSQPLPNQNNPINNQTYYSTPMTNIPQPNPVSPNYQNFDSYGVNPQNNNQVNLNSSQPISEPAPINYAPIPTGR